MSVDAVQVAGIAALVPPAGVEFLCTVHEINSVVVLVFSAKHISIMRPQIVAFKQTTRNFLKQQSYSVSFFSKFSTMHHNTNGFSYTSTGYHT